MKNSLRIVFMGTPSFASYALEQLLAQDYNVVAVVTAPDRPAGRGQKLRSSDVKKIAYKHGLPILQPPNLKNERFITALKSFNADVQVVVAFRMLPKVVWQMPTKGTFNLHASLLPAYRGAAPINWAIINGEQKTGVTTFFIDEKIDTGAVILQKELTIKSDETAGSLHDKLMVLGSELIIKTLNAIFKNNVISIPQPKHLDLTKQAPKLKKENCKIDWSQSSSKIVQHIRGLSPYPGAWTQLHQSDSISMLKIFNASVENKTHTLPCGKVLIEENTLKIACGDGLVRVSEIQLEGKRKMQTKDLLNGFKFSEDAKVL